MDFYDKSKSKNNESSTTPPTLTPHASGDEEEMTCMSDFYPEHINAIVREIINTIEGAGLTRDATNHSQLLSAVQAISAGIVGGGESGGFIQFDYANIVSLSSQTADVGWTDLNLGAAPAGANAAYVLASLDSTGDDYRGTLEIKDSNGNEIRVVRANAHSDATFGEDSADNAILIDISGEGVIQYRLINVLGGSGAGLTLSINKYGWVVPSRSAASLQSLELKNRSESATSSTSKTATAVLTSQLINADKIEGAVFAVIKNGSDSYPIQARYTFSKINGVWNWNVIGAGTRGDSGSGDSASASGTGQTATLPQIAASGMPGNVFDLNVSIADFQAQASLTFADINTCTLDVTAEVSALAPAPKYKEDLTDHASALVDLNEAEQTSFTNISIGTPPTGKTSIFLSLECFVGADQTSYTLTIKDTNGTDHVWNVGGYTVAQSRDGRTCTIFTVPFDISGVGTMQYKWERFAGGADTNSRLFIRRVGWM